MADEQSRMRLGRGLAALLGDVGNETAAETRNRAQRRVPVEFLRPNPLNPRQTFGEEELEELASSIRERDIIQPIIVRGVPGSIDAFEIIAGERRWRAAQRAGLRDVPIVLVEADDKQALEFAIIENIQRADLNALDEARGYENLIAQHGYTQSDLAKVMGKSRSHVANTLRLARLPDSVKEKVASGQVSAGHARALLAVADPELMARKIIDQGLTVRDIERVAQRENRGEDAPAPSTKKASARDADTAALELRLAEILGLTVEIDHRGEKGGVLKIRYRTLEQLELLSHKLASGGLPAA
ncbi:ParB/RepB/Spo0J family partition protein [Rhabdaerophilum sp. SD176]|uniref:ParB/RepB/Spo0J family partition protein n=1 Tax=Rhabdaerophilum sp. SD176 TaxID=2983548 RepID=UPI0024DFB255|nr:ParB/RepB/Spo0J family partition protein [Rhabdaerophilum sp. SD176]